MFDTPGCLPFGSGSGTAGVDQAIELRRQAVLVDDLLHRVANVVRELPGDAALVNWWGPARDGFHATLECERTQLGRAIYRLDSVRIQLEHAALLAESARP